MAALPPGSVCSDHDAPHVRLVPARPGWTHRQHGQQHADLFGSRARGGPSTGIGFPDHHRLIPALAEWTRRLAAVMRWSGVYPRTPHPAGDQGRHKQMIDPVAEPGQAAECLVPAVRRDQRHGTRRRSLRRRLLRRSARRARDRRLRWQRRDGPCRSPPAHVSLERHASGGGPVETSRRRVTCEDPCTCP